MFYEFLLFSLLNSFYSFEILTFSYDAIKGMNSD